MESDTDQSRYGIIFSEIFEIFSNLKGKEKCGMEMQFAKYIVIYIYLIFTEYMFEKNCGVS